MWVVRCLMIVGVDVRKYTVYGRIKVCLDPTVHGNFNPENFLQVQGTLYPSSGRLWWHLSL